MSLLSLINPNRIWNHHHKVFEVACEKYDYGVAKSCCVMALCSWVCFDTWFLFMRYGVKLTKRAPLLDAAEFFETRSSLVEASRYPKFM